MWLDVSSNFKSSSNEAVKKADEQLKAELAELNKEIETNELVYGIGFVRPFTSVPVPRDSQLLARERKLCMENQLKVYDIRKPYIQADVMMEQIESSTKDEYTVESLPIILHQFFLDKISWLIQSKHAHLLRWKRFSEHTSVIEDNYSNFKNRIGYILSDYNDSLSRAQRLKGVRDTLLNTGSTSGTLSLLEQEDILIYMRWLICHFYSQKSFQQAVKMIEWMPYQMSTDSLAQYNQSSANLSMSNVQQEANKSNPFSSSSLKYNNSAVEELYQTSRTVFDAPGADLNNMQTNSLSNIFSKLKVLDNLYLPSSNGVLPKDDILNSISFIFNQNEVPIHNNNINYLMPKLKYLVNYYKIDYNLSRMQTSGDEMELFAAVNRKFRFLFAQQEHMKMFRVYDSIEVGTDNWGADSPMHALKKESNWLEFRQIKPQKDPFYEKEISKLKQKHTLDQFLLPHNSFLEIKDDERVQEALRENATVKAQTNIEPISVTTNPTQFNSTSLWKKIFHNFNTKSDTMVLNGVEITNETDKSQEPKLISFRSRSSKKQDEFNFVENLQKLGLDDNKNDEHNLSNVQGSYLSFLLLRHLRIRDLKRQAIGFLNYFRSIEKTLTIYDGGLSLESNASKNEKSTYKRQSPKNYPKETPYGKNLGDHSYLFNSPKDFLLSEAEFMEFNEIENHDDFYSIDEKGFVHVQDQKGYYVVYDAAIEDFKKLEQELIYISSYYIAKDKETNNLASKSLTDLQKMKQKRQQQYNTNSQDVNLSLYSHQNIDRFSILMDIWTNEVNYLEMKKNLIDVYFECYQNIFDKHEKRNISQSIVDIIYKRVRFDFEANYFTLSYRLEVSCMYKQSKIVKHILEQMIDNMRHLLDDIDKDKKYGLPLSIPKTNLISLIPNSYGYSLKNFYLLEFHPCLASASRLPAAFKHAIETLNYYQNQTSLNERLSLEQSFYNNLLEKMERQGPPGSGFTPQIQKEIFNGLYIEDPLLMTELVEGMVKQVEESTKNKTKKEQSESVIHFFTDVLEMITLRYRILNGAIETETLAKLYKSQAIDMGYEEYHMYLRYVQFDFAKFKESANNPPPIFASDVSTDDSQLDRYIPNSLQLAVNEIEEGQIGRFSFKAKENILQLLKPGGIENLKIILKLQLTHNNSLISAVMQAHSCFINLNIAKRIAKNSVTGVAANLSAASIGFVGNDEIPDKHQQRDADALKLSLKMGLKSTSSVTTSSSKITQHQKSKSSRLKDFSHAFVSIQLEKNPYRDRMLNEYIRQKETKGMMLSNPSEMEKLKRNLMNEYANNLNTRSIQYSLRSQLIVLYFSITKILENFPNTRDNHFVFGEPFEKQNQSNDVNKDLEDGKKPVITDEYMDHLAPDARLFKKRPRKLLSDDGKRVLNIWFIPHYTELLTMYKKNHTDEFIVRTLKYCVRILTSLNDILNFLYANACMNLAVTSSASTDSSTLQIRRKIDFSSWENSGGLDTELNEIQLEMNQLSNPCDPELVVELLEAKRSSMLLQFECAIRYPVNEIFLANGNIEAYKIVNENMHFSLRFINDYLVETSENVYMNVPEPFEARDEIASKLFPWRTFISKHGIFPMQYWPWYLMEQNLSLCLTGLKDIEKNIANGEILGVTLMMEDLLLSSSNSEQEIAIAPISDQAPTKTSKEKEKDKEAGEKDTSDETHVKSPAQELIERIKGEKLINNYGQWHSFLLTWKRLELLKTDWGRRKLGVENINTPELYSRYCESYKKEVLIPVLKILIKNPDLRDQYENMVDYKQPVILPHDVSELNSKRKQISRLLEKMELSMIDDTMQRVQKETKLVVTERAREESTLATDLWKKSIMKEEFTINKPHIADDFARILIDFMQVSNAKSDNEEEIYLITKSNLNKSLISLGNMVQERERSNFEQYALYYESLMRHQHQLLYFSERQIKSLQNSIDTKNNEINVEVQCQMADICYDLIMEVTALRSKLTEMTESRENLEKELRDKVKGEFLDLVVDLVNVNNNLKGQIDHFKETIHANVLELLSEARNEAFDQILKLKNKFGMEINEQEKNTKLLQEELIKNLQQERSELRSLLIKQKNFSNLKLLKNSVNFTKKLTKVTAQSDAIKRKEINNSLLCEERLLLLDQEKLALKKQLAKQDSEYNNLKSKLEKELKEKQDKEHELQQKLKSEKNLISAKQSNVEKLFEELEYKDIELRNLQIINEKTTKFHSINDSKVQKEVFSLKKNLLQERNLKLDAFQRVDELQAQVYDLEDELTHVIPVRPKTSIGQAKNRDGRSSALTSINSLSKYASPFPRLHGYTSTIFDTANASHVVSMRPKSQMARVRINQITLNNASPQLTTSNMAETPIVTPIITASSTAKVFQHSKLREFRVKSAKS